MASQDGRQPRLVVHNTFLEFDEQAVEENVHVGRRPRAQTDITETKLPRKVSYHVTDEEPGQSHGGGAGGSQPFGKLGSLSEVAQQDFSSPLGGFPGAPPSANPMVAAAAAAAAGLPSHLLPPSPHMPVPNYYHGLTAPPNPWPPWQAFPPGSPHTLPPPHPGAWPPYPHMPPYPSAMDHAALAAATAGASAAAAAAAAGAGHVDAVAVGRGPVGVGAVAPGERQATRSTGYGSSSSYGKGKGKDGKDGKGKGKDFALNGKSKPVEPGPAGEKVAISNSPTDPPVNGTTIMLRNLPNRYNQEALLEMLDSQGFKNKYDFVYLPMDFRNGINLGYAFVNTLNHQDALKAIDVFQGFGGWAFESTKVCEVSWAHPHQGLEEHVERYRNSPVMHPSTPEDYKPMVFRSGVRVPFPPPTKAIRAPKLKMPGNNVPSSP